MRIGSIAAFALALLLPWAARALPVEIAITNGLQHDLRDSWLQAPAGDGAIAWHTPGSPTHALRGTLYGELTEDALVIHASALQALDLRTWEVLSLTLEGQFDLNAEAGGILGFLDYSLAGESGTFEFYNQLLAGGPANAITATSLHLWGVDFGGTLPEAGIAERTLGIYLDGRIRPVPEPSAALLFAAGGLLLAAAVRVREPAARAPSRPRS